jgi:hypothetical protein
MVKTIIRFSLRSFWLYGPAVATVILSYFMLTNLSQGQDVVMQAGEKLSSFLFGVLSVMLWAFLVWYSSRLIGYEKKFRDPNWPTVVLSGFPRLLAYNAFVSVQAAILALPTMCNWNFWWTFLFVFIHNGYYFILFQAFQNFRSRKVWVVISALIALAYVVFLFLMYRRAEVKHQEYLPVFAGLLFALQIGWLAFFVWRRVYIDQKSLHNDDDRISFVTLLWVKVIRVPEKFIGPEQFTFNVFNFFSFFGIILYLVVLKSVPFASAMGPLAVVLLAFGIIAGGANIFSYLSIRLGVNTFLILFIVALLMARCVNDPYGVALSPTDPDYSFQQRKSLKEYFTSWVGSRKKKIAAHTGPYPVYIVLADGGASRSGYWVASVLGAWQDESIRKDSSDKFSDHLFCLSGASGGSVGNATFYALLKNNSQQADYTLKAQRFLRNDFLSSCLAYYLGPDLGRHFFPWIPFQDRAEAISETMDYWSESQLQGVFSKNISDVFDSSGRLPILFINTTHVQEGIPAVVSPIKLGFSERMDVLTIVDSTRSEGLGNISFSKATMLSARFPYISPAGKIGKHYFVDGGYFDNSGAGIVHEMLQSLVQEIRNDSLLSTKLRFEVIHITNTPDAAALRELHPLTNDLAAPLVTVFNTYDAQTQVNDKRLNTFLIQLYGKGIEDINLYRTGKHESYPMNWVISEFQLNKMRERLEDVKTQQIQRLIRQ